MWKKVPLGVVLLPEAFMPHRRPDKKGSFGGHLEELVRHFPEEIRKRKSDEANKKVDSRALREKIDIHAALFRQAWQLERDRN